MYSIMSSTKCLGLRVLTMISGQVDVSCGFKIILVQLSCHKTIIWVGYSMSVDLSVQVQFNHSINHTISKLSGRSLRYGFRQHENGKHLLHCCTLGHLFSSGWGTLIHDWMQRNYILLTIFLVKRTRYGYTLSGWNSVGSPHKRTWDQHANMHQNAVLLLLFLIF